VETKILPEVGDPHSLIIRGNSILVCSTASNSIEEYDKKEFTYKGCYW